ncbi:acyltransferase family protein [Mucilaginibacter paludis]|uniref:Acyltransferase 3 domain-containing protein n=1 Tax=Mucilaginibacter paludis DSM 18603 TaxID=714943 RepID=H1Y0J4_9SPHI|nr:acyltransferase family protein [Mucilaginibacter paludis]EHQ28461.1 hypothetical protein Mucpa_4371 [Mucilaginibacter paludis DSM 18603]
MSTQNVATTIEPAKSPRNVSIDIVRLIAAFGVITIHVPFSTPAAGSINEFFSPLCVPFFFLVSLTYFISGLNGTDAVNEVFGKFWKRIILPFWGWTLIYTSLLLAKDYFIGGVSHHSLVFWRILFYGESAVQLYYLPQLVVLQLFAFSLYVIWKGDKGKKILGLGLLLLGAFYIAFGHAYNVFGVLPVTSILIYLIAATAIHYLNLLKLTLSYRCMIIGFFLLILILGANFLKAQYPFLRPFAKLPIGGIGLLLLIIGLPKFKVPQWVLILCSTSYGIYLSHVVFLEFFETAIRKIHHGEINYDLFNKLALVTLIFICSIILTLVLRKVSFLRKVLLGEGK